MKQAFYQQTLLLQGLWQSDGYEETVGRQKAQTPGLTRQTGFDRRFTANRCGTGGLNHGR